MKIAQVGTRFKTIPSIDYFSSQTFLEYDALIIDLDVIHHASSKYGVAFYRKRKNNLEEFLKIKKVPIIYLSPRQNFFDINDTYSPEVLMSQLMPIPAISLHEESGEKIFINSKTPFYELLKKYQLHFYYTHYYEGYKENAIAGTPYTSKTLGFYTENVVFLPKMRSLLKETEEREFLKEVLDLLKGISFIPNSNPLPEWTKSYFFPNENDAIKKVNNLQAQISQLNGELENISSKIETITQYKMLLTASGDELELKVETIFKELGFEIIEAERNRDDLIIKYGDTVAVVEVKGLINSAAEKNAAQLEKWRATYYEKNEVNPKGILLVNAYRETPLALRDQPAFPNQMLAYAKGREHCLMTTTQLLTIYFEAIKNPASKEAIIKSIFDTVGLFNTAYKWQDYINVVDEKK